MERPQRFEAHSQGGTAYEIDLARATEVQVGVEVQDVVEVDCQRERFTAIWSVKMQWTDPELKGFRSTLRILDEEGVPRELEGTIVQRKRDELWLEEEDSGEKFFLRPWHVLHEGQPQWDKHFFPEHGYENLLGPLQPLAQPLTRLDRCTDTGGVVVHKAKYLGTFSAKLDLRHFPFDRQLLRMNITAERGGVERYTFAPMPQGSSGPSELNVAEWAVDRHMQDACTLLVSPVREMVFGAAVQYASAKVVLHVERRSLMYLSSAFLPLFLLVSGSALSFVAPLEEAAQRAFLQAVFLFATVSYKYTLKDWVPWKPYLTRFDSHFIKALLLHVVLAVESLFLGVACRCHSAGCLASVGRQPRGSDAGCPEAVDTLDACIWVVAYVMWILDHMWLLYCVRCRRHRPLRPAWREVYAAAGERQSDLPAGLLRLIGVPARPGGSLLSEGSEDDLGAAGVPVIRQARQSRDVGASMMRRSQVRLRKARRAEAPRPADSGQTPEVPRQLEEVLSVLRNVNGSLVSTLGKLTGAGRRSAPLREEEPPGRGRAAEARGGRVRRGTKEAQPEEAVLPDAVATPPAARRRTREEAR